VLQCVAVMVREVAQKDSAREVIGALYVAVCCSVLQCVAAGCSVLQCVAVCCSVLQCVAVMIREVAKEGSAREVISELQCVAA